MKKVMIYILIIVLLGVIIIAIIPLSNVIIDSSNPLRNRVEVKENMLKLMPIGMSMGNVVKVIDEHEDWEPDYADYHYGERKQLYDESANPNAIFGKTIRVYLGTYTSAFGLDVSVTAICDFDDNSNLIDIVIWEDVNGL